MKETTYKHADLLNLTRWITLVFLIALLATPHLRQQEREAQAVAFGNAGTPGSEIVTGAAPGVQMLDREGDGLGDHEQDTAEMRRDSQLENPSVTGIPGPMAPIKDQRARSLHASSPASPQQAAGESKSNAPSNEKEKPADPYDGIIQKAAERYEVDPALVKAIIMAESSYNPRAVSRKGAQGLMQLMPSTARALGVKDIFDPEHNIDAGVRYFRKLLNQFNGNVKLAIAAYNAGSRKVRMYKGIPPFKYTRYYVAKVIEYHQRYRQ